MGERPSGDPLVFLAELSGPDLLVVSASQAAGPALAGTDACLIGCRLAEVLSGASGQRLIRTLQTVHATGRHARNVLWRAQGPGQPDEADRAVFSVSVLPVRRLGESADGVVVAGLRTRGQPSARSRETAAGTAADGHRAPGQATEETAPGAVRPPGPAAGWSRRFPADPQALTGLRAGLRGWLAGLGADAADRADVELAVWEAAVNAAVHGRPRHDGGTVTVQAALEDPWTVVIRVTDRGRWQLSSSAPNSGPGWAGGRGLSVISQIMDDVSITPSPAGTTVIMRRRVAVSPAAR